MLGLELDGRATASGFSAAGVVRPVERVEDLRNDPLENRVSSGRYTFNRYLRLSHFLRVNYYGLRPFYLKVHRTSVTCDVMRRRRANTRPGG